MKAHVFCTEDGMIKALTLTDDDDVMIQSFASIDANGSQVASYEFTQNKITTDEFIKEMSKVVMKAKLEEIPTYLFDTFSNSETVESADSEVPEEGESSEIEE